MQWALVCVPYNSNVFKSNYIHLFSIIQLLDLDLSLIFIILWLCSMFLFAHDYNIPNRVVLL